MKIFRHTLVFLLLISFNINSAQELGLTDDDYIVKSSWMVGLGYNFVDDSGYRAERLLDVKDNWNALAYPSRLSIGRYFKSGLGIEGIVTYNKYKVGKIVDRVINTNETDYLAFDSRLSYDLNKIIGETGFFDPYVGVGLGYADVNDDFMGSYNAIVGFRAWFSDRIGIDISSTGKWGMGKNDSNHLQHAVGVVYQFGVEKGLSPKGMRKLELINETQRITDSINAAKKAEEDARRRAEQLAREKEQARLAAEEKAKVEARKQRRIELENEVKAVGNVSFAFNSSALSKGEKERLDKIAVIMKANPTLTLKVHSHADSRGTNEFNMDLSKKRVQNTIDYMVNEKGIDASRLDGEGFGETQLLNDCDGSKPCPESMHRVNRRSEFKVLDF